MVKVRDTAVLRAMRESERVPVGKAGKTRPRSQREFAASLEPPISHGHYAEIEGGNKNPSYKVAERIATKLGTTLSALFEESPLEYGDPAEASA